MVYAISLKQGQIISAKMDRDVYSHEFDFAVGPFGVIDHSPGRSDADYEVVLMERGEAVGTAVFGKYDADYAAFLTPENFFATAALGLYDADCEAVLRCREPLGAPYFLERLRLRFPELRGFERKFVAALS